LNKNTEGVTAHTGCQPVWRALCIGPLVRGVPWQDNRFECPIARPQPIFVWDPSVEGRTAARHRRECPATDRGPVSCVVKGEGDYHLGGCYRGAI
jgi:hypothetical protein